MNDHKPKDKAMISVVIPSFNDDAIIFPFYRAICETLEATDYDFELIYVDDGSSDNSPQTLRQLAEGDPRVACVQFYKNFGQQRALYAGLQMSRGDYVVTIDGDYQSEPESILQIVSALEKGYDMASGVREGRKDSFFSVWSSKAGNFLINRILRINIRDFGSVKGFARPLVDQVLKRGHCFSDVYPTALSLGPNLKEVPVQHRDRMSGKSHWNLWMRLRLYLDLYVSYSDTHFDLPFRFGVIVMILALIGTPAMLTYKAVFGHQASVFQILLYSFVLAYLGVSSVGWSILMAFVIRIYKQNISDLPYHIRYVIRNGSELNE